MHKKLYFSYLAIILLAIGMSAFIFWNKGYEYVYEQSQEYYLNQAKLMADIFSEEEMDSNNDYETFVLKYSVKYKFRITLIDKEGKVLADSSTEERLENHKSREEVIGALRGNSVTVNRYSKTMGQEYSYSAVPLKNGDLEGVLRISLPIAQIKFLNRQFADSIVYAIILCFILAVIAAAVFTNLLAKPVNEVARAAGRISEGDYNIKIYTRDKSVVGKLADSFNIMAANLKGTIDNLTKRNAELEAMLSSMTAGVVAIGDTSEILFYNKAFLEVVKPDKEIIQGVSLYNFLRNAAVFDAIDQVRDTNSSVTKEGTLLKKTIRNIRVTATPLGLEGEHYFGVLLIIEDVTQLKKLESIRTDFVSNVTHELKTPLTSIRGFIDTLKNGAIKDEAIANRFLDIIDIEAERLYSLIQDILLLSEIESKREYESLPCDINETINAVIELLQPKITDKVKINFCPKPYVRPFYCNPDRMKQLFINLLDNAIKYTEEGTISVDCLEEGNTLFVQIKDTGIGIEKEHLARIFERFYRVDRGRSRKQGGTGLGLSIVKHIVELYNGNIQVDSTLGVGTEFKISFPYLAGLK
ncbi:PAS domain-containing sensor histidine kinase [Anaerocolumna cellulosilytica]|uniref:histidine kinase n=1 Tax=Anaerocolumna cellulosilytica TaxID=433286 RepID=A0A6S6R288_9FIRM|nr:ATP-binding protein [Anaerocolumna cellulosilytica]MBB5197830.1 two-component system phosphate regulon sensor histidine kinase PhoR [Anaerocolumna cellulosilytica]BCJ96246.1 PAS domain-containing sensor histidine kinase [Anaerocolumna cellulosilytica]